MFRAIPFLLGIVIVAAQAQALPVPRGYAGVTEGVMGKASVSLDGSEDFKALSLGQPLHGGALLRTGANGRAQVRLADGSLLKVAPNTELFVKRSEARTGTLLRLVKGFTRFLVARRAEGQEFKIETGNAVAAVKGTDGEVGTDGGNDSEARVFESEHDPAMGFTSSDGKDGVDLSPGEQAEYDGKEFIEKEMTQEERQQRDNEYQGLPGGGTGEGNSQDGEQGQGGGGGQAPEDLAGLDQAMLDAFNDAFSDLGMDALLDTQERTSDLVTQALVHDRWGDEVQVSHYVERPDPMTVTLRAVSERTTGPNAGISECRETTIWNRDLPEDWMSVAKRALDDPANLDPLDSNYPIFWRTYSDLYAHNPWGDNLQVLTLYDNPAWLASVGGQLVQGYSQFLLVGTNDMAPSLVYDFAWTSADWTNGDPATRVLASAPRNSTTLGWDIVATPTQAGGWEFAYSSTVGPTLFLTQTIHQLDDLGNVQPFAAVSPALPRDLAGGLGNYEVEFSVPQFNGRTIDLMFLPGQWDLFKAVDFPVPIDTGQGT